MRADEPKILPVSSSTPPQFPGEQKRLFREVLRLMNDRNIPYVVSGAFALHEHTGIWRDTKDLDLFLPPEDVGAALKYLAEDGFSLEVTDPVWLAKAVRADYFVDLITGMSNGVIKVDRSWIERSHKSKVMGVPSRVLAAEELIASKVFVAFRERFDGADIVHIIFGTQGKLDWERILHLLGDHWGLLLHYLVLYQYVYPKFPGYVPQEIWDRLLGRLSAELHQPGDKYVFRGSLVDENMFAIDVEEWGLPNPIEQFRAEKQKIETNIIITRDLDVA
jgi:glycosyltransferase involved in cell wall biosynthesis